MYFDEILHENEINHQLYVQNDWGSLGDANAFAMVLFYVYDNFTNEEIGFNENDTYYRE